MSSPAAIHSLTIQINGMRIAGTHFGGRPQKEVQELFQVLARDEAYTHELCDAHRVTVRFFCTLAVHEIELLLQRKDQCYVGRELLAQYNHSIAQHREGELLALSAISGFEKGSIRNEIQGFTTEKPESIEELCFIGISWLIEAFCSAEKETSELEKLRNLMCLLVLQLPLPLFIWAVGEIANMARQDTFFGRKMEDSFRRIDCLSQVARLVSHCSFQEIIEPLADLQDSLHEMPPDEIQNTLHQFVGACCEMIDCKAIEAVVQGLERDSGLRSRNFTSALRYIICVKIHTILVVEQPSSRALQSVEELSTCLVALFTQYSRDVYAVNYIGLVLETRGTKVAYQNHIRKILESIEAMPAHSPPSLEYWVETSDFYYSLDQELRKSIYAVLSEPKDVFQKRIEQAFAKRDHDTVRFLQWRCFVLTARDNDMSDELEWCLKQLKKFINQSACLEFIDMLGELNDSLLYDNELYKDLMYVAYTEIVQERSLVDLIKARKEICKNLPKQAYSEKFTNAILGIFYFKLEQIYTVALEPRDREVNFLLDNFFRPFAEKIFFLVDNESLRYIQGKIEEYQEHPGVKKRPIQIHLANLRYVQGEMRKIRRMA